LSHYRGFGVLDVVEVFELDTECYGIEDDLEVLEKAHHPE
jgi:hypothetical protein